MAKDLLLELGMEEIPARFIRNAVEQLQNKVSSWLQEARIEYEHIQAFATPRRMAILVRGTAEKQKDIHVEMKGPARKIALDEQGNWSKAALGFARSQGANPDDLFFKKLNEVEYVYAVKSSIGVETSQLLSEALTQIIQSMTFPKNMRWANYELKFVRPIRWIAALYGAEVIQIELTRVKSNNRTKGHRFLGEEVEIPTASQYVDVLREQYVYADIEERKQLIQQQIQQIAEKQQWEIAIQEELLEEVLFLVEYPTALFGSFDPEFLAIPQEVLITSMREHQRYFPVLDKDGNLLPHFVTVRNGDRQSLDNVARGNEKVLRARLQDAKFFYEEDQKLAIDNALDRLEKIVFHEELGTVGDKVRRIRSIASKLAAEMNTEEAQRAWIDRAAQICKFDLVTLMVHEFPELQGVMGEDYALKAGEVPEVAKVVNEHYQPRFSGDASPQSLAGAVVSIADKIDTIVGCFSIGIIPTGSQDPYALRRQAAGIVQILRDHPSCTILDKLFRIAIDVYKESPVGLKRDEHLILQELYDFFALRVRNLLSDSVRYDVIDAAMDSGFGHITLLIKRANVLMNSLDKDDSKQIFEAFNRVNNLAAKAESEQAIDQALFVEKEEESLYNAVVSIQEEYWKCLSEERVEQAFAQLTELKQPITDFFDTVMVMAEEANIRSNRLALLTEISKLLRSFADFQKIIL